MMIKIMALVFLAIGAVMCFTAEKAAEKFLKDNSESAVLKIKMMAYIPIIAALCMLFI